MARGYESGAQNLLSQLDYCLPSVNMGNINNLLYNFLHYHSDRLNKQEVQSYVQWIVNKTIHVPISPVQGLFICVVSGYISALQRIQLPQSEEIKKAFDMLLNCLTECEKCNYFNLNCTFVRQLQQISRVLVKNSSCPGWLTFAAHFYHFFEMKRFLDEHNQHMSSTNYNESQYQYLLGLLLPKIKKVSVKNELTLKSFLKLVFQEAPEGVHLFELCENQHMKKFFRKAEERQKFFTECYLDGLKKEDDVGEILKKLLVIPKTFRSLKWAQIYHEYLLKFLKSDVIISDEDVKALLLLSSCLPKDQMYNILSFLSKSTSLSHQDIVLQFLRDTTFHKNWKNNDKIEIAKSWLTTRLQTTLNSDETKVQTTFTVLQELVSCQPVYKNQQKLLLDFVRKWLFDNVAYESIIAGLGKIDNNDIPRNFHDSIFKLAEDVLRKNLQQIKKDDTLHHFLKSRYAILSADYMILLTQD